MGQIVFRSALAAVLLGASTACADSTGPAGAGEVTLNFRVSGTEGGGVGASAPSRVPGPAAVVGPSLVIVGTNGALTIDEILLIVDEVELHRADGFCADGSIDDDSSGHDSDDDCGELEMLPRFLDLPLDGYPIEVATASVPPGAYKRLDFEIEDLEDDESDPAKRAAIAAVRAQILAVAPGWPRKASARVSGSFTPAGGVASTFTVYLEAEIEIEIDLVPNLVVDDQGAASRSLTVNVSPALWFTNANGTVMDLTSLDFGRSGRMLEFEIEMKDGFTKIEID